MTTQEISNFVNQPIPRKIPSDFPRSILYNGALSKTRLRRMDFHILKIVLWFVWIPYLLFFLTLNPLEDLLLDIGVKRTAQGTVISKEQITVQNTHRLPYRYRKYYRLVVSFSTPKGEVTANCYVYNFQRITSWETIPESLGEQASDLFARLKEPFPVPIEYIPWYPSVARAANTRVVKDSDSFYLVTLFFIAISVLLYAIIRDCLINERILKNGQFVTGHVMEIRARSTATNIHYACDVEVSFIGKSSPQVGYCKVPWYVWSKCSKWSKGISVGLMYLPNRKDILITDLWLDDYPVILNNGPVTL